MSPSFADLGVTAEVVNSLRARGITSAFPIQELAIPPALAGKDICGRAPTGSGKTIAFGIPIAAVNARSKPGSPRALILAPTRELAAQIEGEIALLMGPERRRRVASFYGGVGFGLQLKALRHGVDVAIACPGRLKDLIERGAIRLSDVSMVVIDEADRMADMGFLPEVKRILDQVRPDRQTLLFSATLDGDVDELVRRYQRDPVHMSVETDEDDKGSTTHEWVETRREDRVALAAEYVASHGSTVVFCRTKHSTDRVAKQLVAAGVKAVPIHGGRTQSQRDRALAAFSSGRVQALVATDVAARGIHVDGVRCVLHFDIPATDKDYLHRSGRTGRAGADGLVISFVTPTDGPAARALQRALDHPITPSVKSERGNAGPEASGPRRARNQAANRSQLGRPSRQGPPANRRTSTDDRRRDQSSSTAAPKARVPQRARASGAPRRRPAA